MKGMDSHSNVKKKKNPKENLKKQVHKLFSLLVLLDTQSPTAKAFRFGHVLPSKTSTGAFQILGKIA